MTNEYSRSSVHNSFLLKNKKKYNLEITFVQINGHLFQKLKECKKIVAQFRNQKDICFIVMSPCTTLTILLFISGGRNIIFDAGWPQLDSTILRTKNIYKIIKSWVLDYLSFTISEKILLESSTQKIYVQKKYFVSEKKITIVPTGFNELQLSKVEKKGNISKEIKIPNDYFFFRGKINKEAGLETILDAARILNGKACFIIASPNLPKYYLLDSKVQIINNYLDWEELKFLYSKCFAVIGQSSNSKRINRSLPHKAFESAFFGKPYITSNSELMNLSWSNKIFTFEGGNSESLASLIIYLLNNKNLAKTYGQEMHKIYMMKYSQEVISHKILETIDHVSD